MVWPFKRRDKRDDGVRQDTGLVGNDPRFHEYVEPYHRYWVRGNLPDPGAAIYAYDTIALVPFYPINRFGRVQTPMRATAGPQLWVLPAATVYELPQPTGQIMLQHLSDPSFIPDPAIYGLPQ